MNSGPASRTRSSVKRNRRNDSKTKSSKRSKRSKSGSSISNLPDEILQVILEYVAFFDGSIRLRLVCRRFDAILASLLLSSISAFPSTLRYDDHNIELQMNGSRKSAVSPARTTAPLCPIDSHIRHVTIKLSHYKSSGNYDTSRNIEAYERLLLRIVKHVPELKSIKLLYNLNEIDIEYSEFPPIVLERSQTGMDTLTASALNCIPANIQVEVAVAMRALDLDARSVSLRPADWTNWQHDVQFYHPLSREVLEQWPKSIDEVWEMVDSLDIGADVACGGGHPLTSPPGIGEIALECISNQHIHYLYNYMVPGAFLTLQFPKGFPVHLKKLNLRNPLIVNCTEVLGFLRKCKHLKELSLFAVFNLEKDHDQGLPPELETLELFESGGTILPTFYPWLRQFRYTFVGEPSAGDMSTVRQFLERSQISQLELNIVSTSDFMEAIDPFLGLGVLSAPENLGRYLLQKMSCDYYQFSGRSQSSCRISKRATRPMKESIINLAKSSC
uniref:ARAD1D49324p n=1 Tax=Blastobotrys adeninivorans TaxID=409370 RepID=A0A060TDA7_BLAAD